MDTSGDGKVLGMQISVPLTSPTAGRVLQLKWMASSSLRYREISSEVGGPPERETIEYTNRKGSKQWSD